MYHLKKIFNGKQDDRKITRIVKKWIDGQALIPPIILIRPKLSLISLDSDMDILMPQDGKHRINVAICYGCKSIPVVVMNKQLSEINRILGV